RDLDRSRQEVDVLRAVREGCSGAMTGPLHIIARNGPDLLVDARARGVEDGVDGDAEQSAKRVRVGNRRLDGDARGDRVEVGLDRGVFFEGDRVTDQVREGGSQRIERETDLEGSHVAEALLADVPGRQAAELTGHR